MERHTVTSFDDDLKAIDALIHDMGDLASAMVAAASRSLVTSDTALAKRVIADDALMDAHQRDIDERAITLIAKRQPVAQDLRFVIGAIRMAADLERIGDLAKNIAKRVGVVGDSIIPGNLAHSIETMAIETMAQSVMVQVSEAVAYYEARDTTGLARLRDEDEKIDVQYTAIFRELLTYMMEDPRNITACTHLLFCAKNLERIGDHVTNIAENAYYVQTGRQLPLDRPKQDEMGLMMQAGLKPKPGNEK